MRTTFASALASLPLLAIVSAFEIPEYDKMSLGDANCQNIALTDGHILTATCTNRYPSLHPTTSDLSLDLDNCFANYLGTLNFVTDGKGGYSSSCSDCHLVNTKLVCECSTGSGRTKYNEYELNYWRTIKISFYDFNLRCVDTNGIEKRVDNKEARHFVA